MKIECAQCGAPNDLGRVFCTSCGQKLDLSRHTAVKEIQDSAFVVMFRNVKRIVGPVLAIVIILMIALLIWPVAPGKITTEPRGTQRVQQKMQAVKALGAGQSVAVLFTEKEINSYLETKRAKLNFRTLGVTFSPVGFAITATAAITLPFTIPVANTNQLPYSISLGGTFTDGRLSVQSRVGHLPLPGPLGAYPRQCLAAAFDEYLKDQPLVAAAQNATCSDGQLEMLFKK